MQSLKFACEITNILWSKNQRQVSYSIGMPAKAPLYEVHNTES